MVIQGIVILSLLITQALCAPTGCIESCNSYTNQFHTQLSDISNYGDLIQGTAQLQGLDYSRPGTWTEHNNYNVNNGKVHEEKGQIVDGHKTVRYFKKNYSSSFGTRYPSGSGISEVEQLSNNYRQGIYLPRSEDVFNSHNQRVYNQAGSLESIGQQHDYNKIQSQQHTQSSIRRTNTQSERLEDFGEHSGNSEVTQQSASGLNTQVSQQPSYTNMQSGNWSKIVYGNIPRERGKSYNHISTAEGVISSNTAQTNVGSYSDLNTDSLHSINSNAYKRRPDYRNNLSSMHRNEQQHHTSIASEYEPQQNPSQSTYGVSSYRTYGRREGHVNTLPTSQYINPTSGYTNVLSTGSNGYNRNMYNEENLQQQTDSLHKAGHLDEHQSTITQNQMDIENLRQNIYNQHNVMKPIPPGRVSHYQEQWSSSHRQETSLPVYSSDISQISEQNAQYNSQHRENSFNSAHQTKLGKLMVGAVDLNPVGTSDDCTQGTVEHNHDHSQYRRMYKRSTKDDQISKEQQQTEQSDDTTQQIEDLTQQTDSFDDIIQQTSGKLRSGQQLQQTYPSWKPGSDSQETEDLTQQTGHFDDLTQQTSGKLQFGQQTEQSYEPSWTPSGSQHSDDFTQQTGNFDDLTQQTSGKLQFGQQTEQSYEPSWTPSGSQHSDDFTQQTGNFDDLTQQTSGKLQFGQQTEQSYEPSWIPSGSQHSDDLTQQTGNFDDLTQQTSGKLQFGQQTDQSYQPSWTPSGSHHSDDLTQQTGNFDDLTQQTSGKLQFGQQTEQSYEPSWTPSGSQHSEDLTQQTGDLDDLTQQASGSLHFGQQSHQPRRPASDSQHSEDFTQQTGNFDDFTQQTGKFDDLMQQTSGKLQVGQQSHQPWGPASDSQHSEDFTQQTGNFDDFTQQTGKFDDLMQQTSGKLQVGQQSHQPWGPASGSLHSEDFTQQTGNFDDFTQQTGNFDDLTQQTSGKLQFGQQPHQPRRPASGSQHTEDLNQQTGNFDDFTQQTGNFDDLTQQTSGNLQFGQQSHQPRRPASGSQHSEDFTQQTGNFDDLTQQTSGKLQFGQQSYDPWGPASDRQQSEDFTQQTGDFDDLTQQTSGKLQLGQQSYQPWRPASGSEQPGDFDDLSQQTSGKLQFGQESRQPWGPESASQHSEDLTQQTGDFGGFTQETSGKFEFGQQSQQPRRPGNENQHVQDMTQQNEHVLPVSDINDNISVDQASHGPFPKPAGKPRPRPRYSKVGPVVSLQPGSNSVQNSNNIQSFHPTNEDKLLIEVLNHSSDKSADRVSKLPPVVVPGTEADGTRSQDIRGDQGVGSSTNNDKPSTQKTEGNVFSIDGSMDQGNWLHKSNDATVGLQWHYTYHPSDQRQLMQQADKKDKGGMQQQSTIPDFSDSQDNLDQQQAKNKYIFEDLYQQSSSHGKTESELYQQSQNGQEKDQLELGQQTLGKTEDKPQHHLEPRILEAYGGGPYDELHNENIYDGVTVNPSATLAPINVADSWDIREKPAETNVPVYEATPPPLPVEPLSPDTNEATPPPSFWSRLGNKFTNTFDKAKEKARSIFG